MIPLCVHKSPLIANECAIFFAIMSRDFFFTIAIVSHWDPNYIHWARGQNHSIYTLVVRIPVHAHTKQAAGLQIYCD